MTRRLAERISHPDPGNRRQSLTRRLAARTPASPRPRARAVDRVAPGRRSSPHRRTSSARLAADIRELRVAWMVTERPVTASAQKTNRTSVHPSVSPSVRLSHRHSAFCRVVDSSIVSFFASRWLHASGCHPSVSYGLLPLSLPTPSCSPLPLLTGRGAPCIQGRANGTS